jgi:hypothetical protein
VRVRLLIDVEYTGDITELGVLCADQEPVWVEVNSPHVGVQDKTPVALGGRLMGATPVDPNATLAEPERKP